MSKILKNFNKSKAYPPTFSLRLTFEERALLEKAAGSMPLGSFIRSQLLGKQETFPRRRSKRPVKDHEALGQVLGELGKSRLANNLNQLAKAVNTGSLPVTPDTEKTIQDACIGVQDIRSFLMIALDFPNH